MNKKSVLLTSILGIALVAYNVILFVICGFPGHTAAFWLSWAFMMVAFVLVAAEGLGLGKKGLLMKDWMFGYPIVRHGIIYIIVEFCLSVLFLLLSRWVAWGWAFAPQFLCLCVHGIFAISCFLAKQTIEEVQNNVTDKTRFIKLLRADAEMLVEKCEDADTREDCKKLAEAIRYSDPMSSELLFELEKELAYTVAECDKAVTEKNFPLAKALCSRAMLQLTERNKKCKALK